VQASGRRNHKAAFFSWGHGVPSFFGCQMRSYYTVIVVNVLLQLIDSS
jgi:hypothetical protein